jgi:MFS superfamily sulfate permease-like transporter
MLDNEQNRQKLCNNKDWTLDSTEFYFAGAGRMMGSEDGLDQFLNSVRDRKIKRVIVDISEVNGIDEKAVKLFEDHRVALRARGIELYLLDVNKIIEDRTSMISKIRS